MRKVCKWCGKEFKAAGPRIYCSRICANLAELEKRKERYKKKHSKLPVFKDKPEEERKRICQHCGKEFVAEYAVQRYCTTACQKAANNEQRYARKSAYRQETKKVRRKGRHESHIAEINARAREMGMTYGQWQAQKQLERIHEEMERC